MTSCPRHAFGTAADGLSCTLCDWRPSTAIAPSLTTLSVEDLTAIRVRVVEQLCRMSLYHFVKYSWPVLEPGAPLDDAWYIEAICNHVQAQLEDWGNRSHNRKKPRMQNLRINIPPRMLKSRIVNVCASVWAWLRWPHMKIMSLSANPRVAENCARDALAIMQSQWFEVTFHCPWSVNGDALSKISNTAGGLRTARGAESAITGEGADWQIVDDPHDVEDMYSEVKREGVTNRYTSTIYNRVMDQRFSIRTGIMQRGHEADWSGICAANWVSMVLPMEFDPTMASVTPLGWKDPRTVEGEILHPERFTRELLDSERVRLGSYGYAAQMQQRPAPLEGGLFKRADFRQYDTLPPQNEGCWITVDAAFKKTTSGSRVSIQAIMRSGGQRFVVDNRTAPMTFSETVQEIREMRDRLAKAGAWGSRSIIVTKVLIEDKANGSAIIDELKKTWSDVVESSPGSDSKEARAMSVQPQVQAGSVYLPRNAPWRDDMIHELCTFPNGAKDDQVDALVQCLVEMKGSTGAARSLMMNQ